MFRLDASRALSDFRTERLLEKIRRIAPDAVTLNTRFIHFVKTDGTLSASQFETMQISA